MRIQTLLTVFVSTFFVLHCAFAQGNLTPPGAPAPLFKTLDQVEPRTPISTNTTPGDSDSLFKITQPGSYYLTGNIAGVANKHGIEIVTNHVTIDLMGFTLDGKRATASSKSGIFCTTNDRLSDITIQNGAITGWDDNGIFLGNSLVGFETVARSVVRHIVASTNAGNGIVVTKDSLVEDCICDNNGQHGISLNGSRSVARRNLCRGNGGISGGTSAGINLGALNQTQCVISDNVLINNKVGLLIFSNNDGHLYFHNRCSGNTVANYQISALNRGGVCVLPAQTAAISGSTGGPGSGTTDPFANFSY